jgi:hypothetical protein
MGTVEVVEVVAVDATIVEVYRLILRRRVIEVANALRCENVKLVKSMVVDVTVTYTVVSSNTKRVRLAVSVIVRGMVVM